jgi:superfamily II DNA or RNA helicase
MQPYPYQLRGITEIQEKLSDHKSVVYQLCTGGGKTAIFSFISQWWLSTKTSNVLILAHRTELISQTEETLSAIGIGSEPITAKVRAPVHHSRVYIAMVETAYRRLQKNPYFFRDIGLIITDECHILSFPKLYPHFPLAKILGCTATPCVMKRVTFYKCPYCRTDYPELTECCDEEVQEWSRPFTLSQIYEEIVVGPDIAEIIEFGSVVPEYSFIKNYTDNSRLRTDADGEFTTDSVDAEYGKDEAVFNVLLNYKELCAGKKTIIFNSSAKTNLAVYERFREDGLTNVRMFDSVNKEHSGNRAELLKWFADTPDAVLMNVGVFTTGFDSREVHAIILNRPIGSLALFLQCVGRGGRSSKLIYKDHFILVDGGGNIDRFGEWSSERDWRKIFFKGDGKERAKRVNAEDIQSCPECGCLYAKAEPLCPECGHLIESPPPRERNAQESEDVLAPIRKIPPPNGERIYQYTVQRGENINFAFRLMINQIVDLFRYYRITKPTYEKTLNNGELDRKIKALIHKCYFVLLKKPDIQTEGRRTLANLTQRTKTQLELYYEKLC